MGTAWALLGAGGCCVCCRSALGQAKGVRKDFLKFLCPALMASLIMHLADGDAPELFLSLQTTCMIDKEMLLARTGVAGASTWLG